jgi:hypothetical protein
MPVDRHAPKAVALDSGHCLDRSAVDASVTTRC